MVDKEVVVERIRRYKKISDDDLYVYDKYRWNELSIFFWVLIFFGMFYEAIYSTAIFIDLGYTFWGLSRFFSAYVYWGYMAIKHGLMIIISMFAFHWFHRFIRKDEYKKFKEVQKKIRGKK